MKKLMMVMSVALLALGASAATEDVDGVTWYYEVFYDYSSGKNCARIISGSDKYVGALTIPSTLGDCPVTSIGYSAFSGCSGLTSVMIPTGVTSIGYSAFSGCSGLTSVTIPIGVTSIGESAFSGCSGLKSVTLPEGVMTIGRGAFDGCERLTSLVIPKGITSVAPMFWDCTSLKWVVIPEGVVSIADSAFYYCSELKSVTIPSSVTSIGAHSFYGCSGLMSVTIPEGVTNIGEFAFSGCAAFTEVGIPASVVSFGESAISGCDKLTKIEVADGNTAYKVVNNCLVTIDGTTLVAVPFGCSTVKIPENIKSISEGMFRGDKNLKSVVIPDGVLSIEDSAFSGCSGLLSVKIPDGVKMIEDLVFYECSALCKIDIPDSVLSIANTAFADCSSVRCLTIPASVSSVWVTSGMRSLSSVSWPQRIAFLGSPPSGIGDSMWLNCKTVSYSRKYGAEWQKIVGMNKFSGFGHPARPDVMIVSVAIRENDPTVMDVVYKVTSAKTTVKVRALAFQDGERSFAKVVRPTEFIEDTAKNIGDEIAANEEHKLSWRVSADWKADLAKVKFEVLAVEDDLLPLELTTIPKVGDHAAMEISWNVVSEQQVFDALLWLYADGDEGLVLTDGVLKRTSDGYLLGYGTTVSIWNGRYSKNVTGNGSAYYYFAPAIDYVYSKMGFSLLSGDELKYANEMTRLGLSPSGARQYAWREVND